MRHHAPLACGPAALVGFLIVLFPAPGAAEVKMDPATSPNLNTPPHLVPADKGVTPEALQALRQRGLQPVYSGAALATLGMPCGGIAAGQLYVRGDGTLACWQVDGGNYFSGVGHTSYRTCTPKSPVEQGFDLLVMDDERVVAATALSSAGYDALEFTGEYPRARIRYRARAKRVPPLEVDLEVYSPFVPLNARDSAWPATVLHFTIRNASERPLNVELRGRLDNFVFPAIPDPLTFIRRDAAVIDGGVSSLFMQAVEYRPPAPAEPVRRVLADFEGEDYGDWTVEGAAFGPGRRAARCPVSRR